MTTDRVVAFSRALRARGRSSEPLPTFAIVSTQTLSFARAS
jgi:hypothetical protein